MFVYVTVYTWTLRLSIIKIYLWEKLTDVNGIRGSNFIVIVSGDYKSVWISYD